MGKLTQSAADWAFLKKGVDAAGHYRRLKGMGLAAVELAAPERFPLIRAAGLGIHNVMAGSITAGPSLNCAAERAAAVGMIRERIAFAVANGVPQVIVFSGPRNNVGDEEGIKSCVAGLKEVAGDAEKAGVTLTMEVLNKFDHPGYHADFSAFAFAVARGVGSANVKVLYDIYHMQRMGENLLPAILENLAWIGHFHIAGSPKRNFPGPAQEIDYRTLVEKVLAAGYKGIWGQEFGPTAADAAGELGEAVRLFDSYAG